MKRSVFFRLVINLLSTACKTLNVPALFLCTPLLIMLMGSVMAHAQVPALESSPEAEQILLLDFGDFFQEGVIYDCPSGTDYAGNRVEPQIERAVHGVLPQLRNADQLVHDIWEVVAEDYSPFDVNVTTVEPTSSQYEDDTGRLARVLIGDIEGYKGLGYAASAGCHNLPAYLDSEVPNVAFVRLTAHSNPNARILGRRVSHEAGHLYGLKHQSVKPDLLTYAIMGYTEQQRHAWVQGKNSSGQWQDDVDHLNQVIGPRLDDYGDMPQTAVTMTQLEGPAWLEAPRVYTYGVIESSGDEDMLTFRVTKEGQVTIRVYTGLHTDSAIDQPRVGVEANLVAEMELRNGSDTRRITSGINLALDALAPGSIVPRPFPGQPSPPPTLQTGNYYQLVVRSRGRYEDIGQYTVVIDGPVADFSGPRVVRVDPPCTRGANEEIRVHFDQAVDYRPTPLVSTPPFALLTSNHGPVPLLNVTKVPANDPTPTTFDLIFQAMGATARPGIEIGVEPIQSFGRDPMGQPLWMDQDNDGNNGEDEDVYVKSPGNGPQPEACYLRDIKGMVNTNK